MVQGDEESNASPVALSAPPLADLLSSEIEVQCLVTNSEDENKEEDEEGSSSKRTERKPQLIDMIFR